MKFAELPHGNAALALFPSVSGVGWIVFDGPLSPVAWGVSMSAKRASSLQAKNAQSLAAIERLLARYRVPVVVLEAFDGAGSRRNARIRALCRSIISLCAVNGIAVRIISRREITACFASTSPKTRHATAQVVASYLPEIRHRLPAKRRAWDSENPEMALFNAAALLIVHYANPAQPL